MAMRIGVMMGDPAGIGAELTAQVLAGGTMSKGTGVVIVGDPVHLARGQLVAGTNINVDKLEGVNDVESHMNSLGQNFYNVGVVK